MLRCTEELGADWSLSDTGDFQAITPGIAPVWLETNDGTVRSNAIEVWATLAVDVDLRGPLDPIKQGQSVPIKVTFTTPEGPMDGAVVKATVLDPEMGKIGRKGRFKAGSTAGQTSIRVWFGQAEEDFKDVPITISQERVPSPDGKGGEGGGIPLILLCGDSAPGFEEQAEELRTIAGGPSMPTIIEDPTFTNVVWINDASKEASRVRQSQGGSSGVGRVSSRSFFQFISLKCFDVLKRLYIRQRIEGQAITEYEYNQYAAEAEVECSGFIDAAWELGDRLIDSAGRYDERF